MPPRQSRKSDAAREAAGGRAILARHDDAARRATDGLRRAQNSRETAPKLRADQTTDERRCGGGVACLAGVIFKSRGEGRPDETERAIRGIFFWRHSPPIAPASSLWHPTSPPATRPRAPRRRRPAAPARRRDGRLSPPGRPRASREDASGGPALTRLVLVLGLRCTVPKIPAARTTSKPKVAATCLTCAMSKSRRWRLGRGGCPEQTKSARSAAEGRWHGGETWGPAKLMAGRATRTHIPRDFSLFPLPLPLPLAAVEKADGKPRPRTRVTARPKTKGIPATARQGAP